jgi:hypothetical protein
MRERVSTQAPRCSVCAPPSVVVHAKHAPPEFDGVCVPAGCIPHIQCPRGGASMADIADGRQVAPQAHSCHHSGRGLLAWIRVGAGSDRARACCRHLVAAAAMLASLVDASGGQQQWRRPLHVAKPRRSRTLRPPENSRGGDGWVHRCTERPREDHCGSSECKPLASSLRWLAGNGCRRRPPACCDTRTARPRWRGLLVWWLPATRVSWPTTAVSAPHPHRMPAGSAAADVSRWQGYTPGADAKAN